MAKYDCDADEVRALVAQLNLKVDEDKARLLAEELGRCGAAAIEPVIAALRQQDMRLKPYFAWALAALVDATRLVAEVAAVLPLCYGYTHHYLTEIVLENEGEIDRELFITALTSIPNGKEDNLGRLAGQKLTEIGQDAILPLIEALIKQSETPPKSVYDDRLKSLMALLCESKDERAVTPIIAVLSEIKSPAFVHHLYTHTPCFNQPVFINHLIGVLEDDTATPQAKRNAVMVLHNARGNHAVEALLTMLQHRDPQVRRAAVNTLSNFDDPRIFAPLHELAREGDAETRRQAINALGRLRDERARDPLIDLLKTDDDSFVRRNAAHALENYPSAESAETLAQALRDHDRYVRNNAKNALTQMGEHAHPPLQRLLIENPQLVRQIYNHWHPDWVETARRDFEADPARRAEIDRAKGYYRRRARNCPICGAAWKDLAWIYFSTPTTSRTSQTNQANQTLKHGWLSICDNCSIQVDYFGRQR
jgi:hypothetical protein